MPVFDLETTEIYSLEAMILAGGKGSRLSHVVNDRPKPLAVVSGRPFVEWLLIQLREQGIQRVIFCTGYMHAMVESVFGDGSQLGLEIVYSEEKTPLGTAGAVRQALQWVKGERFLVLNGDSYCPVNFKRMRLTYCQLQACGLLWLIKVENCARYGSVIVGEEGKVQAFQEKDGRVTAGIINAGVYLLNRKMVETIPLDENISLEHEIFPRFIGKGLYGLVGDGPFIDIGTPESYKESDQFFERYF